MEKQSLLSTLLLRLVCRVEVTRLENFSKVGDKAVIIANHLSSIDMPFVWLCVGGAEKVEGIDQGVAS